MLKGLINSRGLQAAEKLSKAATICPAESFLSKVLQALSRANLIRSQRGQSGGFEILPRGRQSSMREVVEAIYGPIFLNICLISKKACGREKWCPAHPVWMQAQQAMLDVLSKARIADMAGQTSATSSPLIELKAMKP
jgi:Rrf2 family protein